VAYTLTDAEIDFTTVLDNLIPANPHCGTA
jgi:hypothetical protein